MKMPAVLMLGSLVNLAFAAGPPRRPISAGRRTKKNQWAWCSPLQAAKFSAPVPKPPLAARAGDILFTGDELRTESGAASFLYCPGKTSQTLDQGGDLLFDAKQLKVRTGKLSAAKPVNSCFLPQLVRVNVASQQHYGVSMTRGLTKPEGDLIPLASLAPNVRTEIDPLESQLRADPNDAAALINEAAIYDRNNLEATALASYRKVANEWKDAVWVRGRIFELEESLATQAALKAAEKSLPTARTFALLIGVSKYPETPAGPLAAIRRRRCRKLSASTWPACVAEEFRRSKWWSSPMKAPPQPRFATRSRLS